MKKLLTILLVILSCHAFAQKDSLKYYNMLRINTTSHGLEILGGWGLLNTAVSVPSWINSTNPEARYFFQMNTVWGSVDFLTALLGYTGTQKLSNKHLSTAELQQQQERIQKIFYINGCLDVVYVGTGLYLKLVGDSRNSPMMKGYGESILLQGSFLLVFDALMYKAEKNNGSRLAHFLEKHPITFDGRRVGMIFNM